MAYTVSEEWREKCYSGESLYDCRLYIGETLVPIEQIANIKISSPIVDNTKDNSNSFYVGSFISQKITIKFNNLSDLEQEIVSNIKSGNDVSLYIGQYTDDVEPHTTYEEIPIGKYIIDELGENYYKNWELVCLDYAIKFAQNLDYSGALHDGSIKVDELLEWICDYYGVTLGSYPTTNGDVLVGSYDNTQSGKYYISCIAEIKGCNAKIDRNGALNLIPIKTPPVVTIDATEGAEWELGEKYEVSKVTYYDAVRNYTFGDDSENTLFIRQDNPFVVDENVVLNIYNSICGEQDTTQVSGTSISIDDTVESPVTLELNPNTNQKTIAGRQLLKNTNVDSGDNNFWASYSTFSEVNKMLTRSVTTTSEGFITHRINGLKSNQTYTLSLWAKTNNYVSSMDLYCYNQNTQGIRFTSISKAQLTTGFKKFTWTFTTASDVDYSTNATIRIDNNGSTTSGTTATLTVRDVMLEEGSTAHDYEDYVGETPSPSPNYPQDVNVVRGYNRVKICNKNLINLNDYTLYAKPQTFTYDIKSPTEIEVHSTTGSYQRVHLDFAPKLPNASYYRLSAIAEDIEECTGSVGIGVDRFPKGATERDTFYEVWFNDTERENGTRKGFYIENVDNEKYDYRLVFFATQTQNIDNKAIFKDIQIEEGATTTEFEEHKEQELDLTLPLENILNPAKINSGSGQFTTTYISDTRYRVQALSSGNKVIFANMGIPSGDYTVSVTLVDGSYTGGNLVCWNANNTSVGEITIGALNERKSVVIKGKDINRLILWNSSATFDATFDIQVERGHLAGPYTPFGTEPLEYCAIGDYKDKFFKTSGKNLFDKDNVVKVENKILNDSGVEINDTGGAYTKMYMPVKPNTTYTTSGMPNGGTDRVYFFDNSKTFISRTSGYTNLSSFSFTTPANCYFIDIQYYMGNNNFNIWQIEEGTSPSTYEPYGTNEWWLEKKIGKYTFTGNETGVLQNSGKRFDIHCLVNNIPECINNSASSEISQIYCNILGASSSASTWSGNQGISYNTGTSGQILVSISGATTTQAILDTIKDNYCYFVLKTPTYIKIEGELADQLEDIYNNMRTQLGQTNIMQDNNDLPFNIDINSYFTQDRFLIYSLKHRNYGDLSLDAWDIVNYDVDGTSYPTLNDNTTTYEMTVMSDVQVSIPTAQQEATTNVIGGTQSQKIKRVSTTVDNLSGQITLNADEIDGLQENVGKLQIQADNISSTVKGTKADVQKLQSDITQKADSVTFNIYKERLDNIEENGVSKVDSTMVKIDETGLSVATNTSKITTTMTNNEFRVVANDDPTNPTKLAFIGYDENEHTSKSEMDNLTVKQYFVAGVHRTEALDLTDPATGNTEKRTSVFYTG